MPDTAPRRFPVGHEETFEFVLTIPQQPVCSTDPAIQLNILIAAGNRLGLFDAVEMIEKMRQRR